ncbi:PAS domain S-box protein [Paenibacillus flagellatus]|nr:PAS domain S-box protein [Paenibacillus flagellatus]
MARKAISQREEDRLLFVSAFKHAPIGMALIALDGRFLKVNEALCRIVGYGADELLKLTFIDITHPDDIYKDVVHADMVLAGQLETYELEKRYVHKEGHVVWARMIGSIVRDEKGAARYFISQIMDITERIHTERELRKHEELYRLISENSQDIISYFTPDLRVGFISPAVESVLGYKPEEVVGRPFTDFVHPQDRQTMSGQMADAATVWNRVRHKDGRYVWIETTFRAIRNRNGHVEKIVAVGRDVTDRRMAAEKLARQEEQYRQLVENSPDAVLITGSPTRGLYINEAGVKLFGGRTEEDRRSILDNPLRFVPPDYRNDAMERSMRVLRGETADFFEFPLHRLDGTVIETEVRSMPTVFQDEPAVYSIIRDTTERKKTQELLRNSEKLSVAGQLAAGIAHEIRNPLTAIKGFHQLMRSGEAKKEYFDILASELNRIEMILTELLVLAKPQQSRFERKNIVSLLRQVAALLETQAIMTSIRILVQGKEDALYILCDENQIKQVFINIIKNAIEAMPDGGDVTVGVDRIGERVMIRVTDQGRGIPESQLARIGQPFYTTKENGTGLGLMVTNKIVENHNGAMRIESQVGVGTTFTIELPV